MIDDYQSAVSHLLAGDDVDPDRVAVVGVCMGGGYAVSLGARDKRLKAVVAIAGGYDIGGTFQGALGVDGFAAYLRQINDLVQRSTRPARSRYVPTVAHELTEAEPIVAMPNEEARATTSAPAADAPNWPERITADSLPTYFAYNAVAAAPLVAPTPLLVVHGTTDAALLPEYAQATYDAAQGTKELIWIETHNHVELYDQDPYVSEAAGHAVAWLDRHGGGMSDREAIADITARLGLLTDARDWPAVRALFCDGVEVDYTSLNGGEPETVPPTDLVGGWRRCSSGWRRPST